MNNSLIDNVLKEQIRTFQKEEYKSFDLCDITSTNYFLKISDLSKKHKLGKYLLYPNNILLKYFSNPVRKAIGIKKQIYPQSLIFIAEGYLHLYRKTGDSTHKENAEKLIVTILENRNKEFSHHCWGQPYDWSSKQIIPANTPRTTVTSQAGNLMIRAYEILEEEKYLDLANDIGLFFLHEMKRSYNSDTELCFSYTAVDNMRVYNPNMMASTFLHRLHNLTNEKTIYDIAIRSLSFVMNRQNEDGSWYYSFSEHDKPSIIDNYHTGYVIESIIIIKKITKDSFIYDVQLNKSIEYFADNLFTTDDIPKLRNDKIYPIDIQSCAQSILTFIQIKDIDEKYENRDFDLLKWTIENLYSNGHYYYRKYKSGMVDKTPYIRWGDAWMFKAACLLY